MRKKKPDSLPDVPVIDGDGQGGADTPTGKPPRSSRLFPSGKTIAGAVVVCLVLAGGVGALTGATIAGSERAGDALSDVAGSLEQVAESAASGSEQRGETTDCAETGGEHQWETMYKTIHHKAKYRKVKHPAKYKTTTSVETVCNVCKGDDGEPLVITGKAAKHQSLTGHGYTRDYVVSTKSLAKKAYTEKKLVKAAYDEQVADHMLCVKCLATKPIEDDDK